MIKEFEIIQPDDFHIHLRQGEFLKHTVEYASKFKKILVMPNLKPPITSIEMAKKYREEILSYSKKNTIEPYLTLYLNENLNKNEIKEIKNYPWLLGIKLYPSGVTTNSEEGISNIEKFFPYFELMEKHKVYLMIHGEINDNKVDIFEREKKYIEKDLLILRNKFPELKITFEHISTKEAIEFINEHENIACTVTPQHLLLTRNDLFLDGIQPHNFCFPILKTKEDQDAIAKEILSGNPKFFAGTDSAPHPKIKKESHRGPAGVFSAPIAIELYLTFFEQNHCFDKNIIENFLSINGSKFYNLPINQKKIKILKKPFTVPESYPFGKETVIPIWAGKTLEWSVEYA